MARAPQRPTPSAARARTPARSAFELVRRGARLGRAEPGDRTLPDEPTAKRRWQAAEPVFLPGVLGDAPRTFDAAIRASLRMFTRLRHGARFLGELEHRLADDRDLRYAGSTVDRDDARELERVFVDAAPRRGQPVHDLWAKLTWLADDASDRSLRIRFSAGLDQLEHWLSAGERAAGWSDVFARRTFPECDAALACAPLRRMLDALVAAPHRLSERIAYNNAPGGGALFHHDAEPGQLGVVFSQLQGRTAWFALSKRRLASHLVAAGAFRTGRAAMRALTEARDPDLLHRLNRDAAFARRLAADGAQFVLQAGDSILLPSHGIDDVAWHSVVALGARPSLAHSYGVFARDPVAGDYPDAADPWLRMAKRRRAR